MKKKTLTIIIALACAVALALGCIAAHAVTSDRSKASEQEQDVSERVDAVNEQEQDDSEKVDAANDEVFYPQLGVKLCSMAGGGVQKIYMVFFKRTVPAGQVRQ